MSEDELAFLAHPALRMLARERTKDDRRVLWELGKHGPWFSRLEQANGIKALSLMEHKMFHAGQAIFREGGEPCRCITSWLAFVLDRRNHIPGMSDQRYFALIQSRVHSGAHYSANPLYICPQATLPTASTS